ncbi:SDR family oxidoreductase [Chitinophaga niabensis]|uniref:SDR family oxidoreductase n=1 Tax=Chitinophaga niabensis TaxID=536979 RepID=UPI0009FCECB5|nr:SDR family oxidoreductase [Chitinophaga niabensis]
MIFYKVRVVNMWSAGSPDSRVFKEVVETDPENGNKFLKQWAEDTMLKELPMMNDIANVAVFLASNMAKMITGVTVDVTAGTTASLNHNVLL